MVLVFWVARRRRVARLRRFGNPETLRQLMPDASPKRELYKFMLLLSVVTLLILAAARPQLGSKLSERTVEGIEMMLIVDVSNSMLAEDFQPNRLERTKFAINRLFDGLKQERVGVIAFAGEAQVVLPITADYKIARTYAQKISPSQISRQGTAIGSALNLAQLSFSSSSEQSSSRVAILITDGENHDDDALAAAEQLAKQGVQVYVIGIGTPDGAPIQLNGDFIKDENGNMVVSKLDEQTLTQIAQITGGLYVRSTNADMGLEEIVKQINSAERGSLTTTMFEEYRELYGWLLALALVLLMLEIVLMERKNPLLTRFSIFK